MAGSHTYEAQRTADGNLLIDFGGQGKLFLQRGSGKDPYFEIVIKLVALRFDEDNGIPQQVLWENEAGNRYQMTVGDTYRIRYDLHTT